MIPLRDGTEPPGGIRAVAVAVVLLTVGCGDGTPPTLPEPFTTTYRVAGRLDAHDLTQAVEVQPAGAWALVVEGRAELWGRGFRLYDLDTRLPMGDLHPLDGVADAALSVEGDYAVFVGIRLMETVFIGLPTGEEIVRAPATGDRVVRHPDRDEFFVGGRFSVVRLNAAGNSLGSASSGADALEVSADGSLLYVFSTDPLGPDRLLVLNSGTMQPIADLAAPFHVQAFVPLDGGRVLALGTPVSRPFREPILSTVVEGRGGTVGPVREVADGAGIVAFSTASPWARIDGAILVPTSYGVIHVEPATGLARMLEQAAFEGDEPCCATARDPVRDQLLVAERIPTREPGGPVVVYAPRSP